MRKLRGRVRGVPSNKQRGFRSQSRVSLLLRNDGCGSSVLDSGAGHSGMGRWIVWVEALGRENGGSEGSRTGVRAVDRGLVSPGGSPATVSVRGSRRQTECRRDLSQSVLAGEVSHSGKVPHGGWSGFATMATSSGEIGKRQSMMTTRRPFWQ